jgi:hypothetical protein
MTRRCTFVALSVIAMVVGATMFPSPLYAKGELLSPNSGPPGTVVTVSGLELCEDGTLTFDSESTPGAHYTTVGTATLVVPGSATPGQHWIFVTCSQGGTRRIGSTGNFTVVGAAAIDAQPRLTG